jgi:hypothetical protein
LFIIHEASAYNSHLNVEAVNVFCIPGVLQDSSLSV